MATSTTSMTREFRRDGKVRRTPRLGVPKSRHDGKHADPAESAPIWEQLVQPGPAGNPARTYQRREDRGQVVRLNSSPVIVERPARQGGHVRLGLWRATRRPRTGQYAPGERVRVVKGNRTPGFVEVRQGNAAERMAVIRQRPVKREQATS